MSPVAHTGIALLGWEKMSEEKNFKTLLLFVLISNFPDIDYFFFVFIGQRAFDLHQYYTHNVFFVALSCILFFPLIKGRVARLGFCLVSISHLVLDLITCDTAVPFGFRLFFPISNRLLDLGIFPNLMKDNFNQIFSGQNFFVLVLEAAVFFVPVLIFFRKKFTLYIHQKNFWRPDASC